MTSNFTLEADHLTKAFAENTVLDGVSLAMKKGERLVLFGPSGSGKTTLLRCLNLLETPDSGRVTFQGDDVFGGTCGNRTIQGERLSVFRARVSMVFQQFELFPHLSVLGNVMLGPVHALGVRKAEARASALEQLEAVGLAHLADAQPGRLSGGQKQRVAIARSLAMSPDVVLFDEPTAALDPELVGDVLATLRTLAERGLTMVIVTHHIGFAHEVADRAVFMENGRIVEQGTPDEVLKNPAEARTRQFLKSVLAA